MLIARKFMVLGPPSFTSLRDNVVSIYVLKFASAKVYLPTSLNCQSYIPQDLPLPSLNCHDLNCQGLPLPSLKLGGGKLK